MPAKQLLQLDEPFKSAEEGRRARLQFQIDEAREMIKVMQAQLKLEQKNLLNLELELINKTPTVQEFRAIQLDPIIEVDGAEIK